MSFTVMITNDSVGSDPVTITDLTDSIHGDLNAQGDCTVPQTIAPGASYSCTFTAFVGGNPNDTETDTVTASGTDDEGNPVSASDDATVTANDVPSSIRTTKTASPTSVPETGGDVTFTIVVRNNGPDEATGVQITDAVPAGLTFVSANPAADYDPGTGVWNVGTISPSASSTLQVVVTVADASAVTNTASVTRTTVLDPNPGAPRISVS